MPVPRFRRTAVTVLVALVLLPVSATSAASFDDVYTKYQHDGFIVACSITRADLVNALRNIPADIRAYDPGFEEGLSEALISRGNGCTKFNSAASTEAPTLPNSGAVIAADGSPGPSNPAATRSLRLSGDVRAGVPVPLALAAAGLLLVIGLAAGMASGRSRGRRRRSASTRRLGLRWTPAERLSDGLFVLRNRFER